jgi:hypothetical protein
MKSFRFAAAALVTASAAVLGGCASEQQAQQPQAQQVAQDRNPCTGVAPPTGSLVRRKEDCGGSADRTVTQEVMDQLRAQQTLGRTAAPAGK